jgi:DNA-binding transcriptional LysR family regulator
VLSGQLDAFLQLVRDGTMRAAASNLYLSQPAFSARIARLESEMGVQLFERRPGGMTLSSAGRAFLPFAESAELTFIEGVRAARAADEVGEPGLRIGAGFVVSDYVMPEVIALFRTECPSVRVSMRAMPAAEIVKRLHNKELDLGVFHWRDDNLNLKTHYLYEYELCPVMAADYAPGDDSYGVMNGAVILAEWPGRYQLPYEASMQTAMNCGQVVHVDSVEVAKRMVLQRIGIAVLPSESVGYELAKGTLVHVPVSGHELVRHKRVMAERPGLLESEHTQIFRKLLMKVPSFIPGTTALTAA